MDYHYNNCEKCQRPLIKDDTDYWGICNECGLKGAVDTTESTEKDGEAMGVGGSLTQSLKEMKQILQGNIEGKTWDEFFTEMKNEDQ